MYCSDSDWQKEGENICYESKDEKPGKVVMKTEGLLIGIKLVHRSGYLNCGESPRHQSRWGCHGVPSQPEVMTVVTNDNKGIIFNYTARSLYGVNGKKSDEIVFLDTDTPIYASKGMEVQIWYTQDLKDFTEHNNSGVHCVDVYVKINSPEKYIKI